MLDFRVNGETVDYYNTRDFKLKLDRFVAELTEPSKRTAVVSTTIKLPNTARNKRFFGHLETPAGINKFRSAEPYVVDLYVDGEPVLLNGKLNVKSVGALEIECFISDSTVGVFDILKERTLRDIESLQPVPFDGMKTVLEINAQPDFSDVTVYQHTDECPIIFPLIAYQNFFIPNSYVPRYWIGIETYQPLNNGFNALGIYDPLPEGREIFDSQSYSLGYGGNTTTNVGLAGQSHLRFGNFPPAAYLVRVLKAIFADIGYGVAGSFVGSPEARRLILPYVGDRPPVWNWSNLCDIEAVAPNVPSQSIEIDASITGIAPTGLQLSIGTSNYEVAYKIDSYPSPFPAPAFPPAQGAWSLFNFLAFPTLVRDVAFSLVTSAQTDYDGAQLNTFFNAPADGEYRFTVSGGSWGRSLSGVAGFLAEVRLGHGIVRFTDGLPERPDFGALLNGTPDGEDLLAYDVVQGGGSNPSTSLDTGWVRLNRGDFVAYWSGVFWPINEVDPAGNPYTIDPPGGYETGLYSVLLNRSGFTFEVECRPAADAPADETFGVDLLPAQNLPDMKQSDFVTELIRAFNLYVSVDPEARIVYFDTQKRFYLPNDFAVDITSKCLDTEGKYIPHALPTTTRYRWADAGDDDRMKELGDLFTFTSVNQSREAKGEKSVGPSLFAATGDRTFRMVAGSGDFAYPEYTPVGADIVLPVIGPSAGFTAANNDLPTPNYKSKPRLLQLMGKPDITGGNASIQLKYRAFDETLPIGQREYTATSNDYVRAGMGVPLVPFPGGYTPYFRSLSFAGDDGLYRQFYDWLVAIVAQGHLTEIEALITPDLYRQLQLRVPILLNGVAYWLNGLENFDPIAPGICKLTLIRQI